jgi:hypothetical protein
MSPVAGSWFGRSPIGDIVSPADGSAEHAYFAGIYRFSPLVRHQTRNRLELCATMSSVRGSWEGCAAVLDGWARVVRGLAGTCGEFWGVRAWSLGLDGAWFRRPARLARA